jgi:hypothetical protein
VDPGNPIRSHFLALWTEASSGNLGRYEKKLWMELEGHLDSLLGSDVFRCATEEDVVRSRALQLIAELASRMEGAPADTPAMRANWAAVQQALRAGLS